MFLLFCFFFHSIMRKPFNHTCGMLLRDQLDRSPDEGPRMFSLTFRCVVTEKEVQKHTTWHSIKTEKNRKLKQDLFVDHLTIDE